jgi:hypothetical protein
MVAKFLIAMHKQPVSLGRRTAYSGTRQCILTGLDAGRMVIGQALTNLRHHRQTMPSDTHSKATSLAKGDLNIAFSVFYGLG